MVLCTWRKFALLFRGKYSYQLRKSCLNIGNLEGKKPECEVEVRELINHSDEDTTLLQIPQDVTSIKTFQAARE